ncbi:MAG TPA: hypothetical protein VF192_12685 [Longimicrobiales bacterium]|jgi:hypothetical protein
MISLAIGWRRALLRLSVIVFVVGSSAAGSYYIARTWSNSGSKSDVRVTTADSLAMRLDADSLARNLFPSGEYLVAFALLASDCGFSSEAELMKAVRVMRDSLRASHGTRYADISVIGVALDEDIDAGLRYLRDLMRTSESFDQISVGGTWLNEYVAQLVWRRGITIAATPQVILIRRLVDATSYPQAIHVQADSVLGVIAGRDDIIAWVNAGTPLDFQGRAPQGQ